MSSCAAGKTFATAISALQRLAATAFLSKLVHHALHIDSCIQVIIIKVHTVPLQHRWVDLKSYPLVNVYRKLWKITVLFMGKSTISMAIFHVAFCMFTRAPRVSIIWAPPSNGKHPSRQSWRAGPCCMAKIRQWGTNDRPNGHIYVVCIYFFKKCLFSQTHKIYCIYTVYILYIYTVYILYIYCIYVYI